MGVDLVIVMSLNGKSEGEGGGLRDRVRKGNREGWREGGRQQRQISMTLLNLF